MNKHEKEVMKHTVEQEKAILSELKKIYRESLDEIGEKIKALMLDELTQSKIYRIEYQKALRGCVSGILDTLNSRQYSSIQEYLKSCYEDGFLGTLYSLNKYGIPLIFPIEQEQVVKALMTDSKISEGMYKKLGHNVSELKKSISQEISRGLSTVMSYSDIARNLQNRSNITLNQSMNIVQTEGHRIQSISALDAAKKAEEKGVELVKVWDSTLDGKTRPHHRQLDGQVKEINEDFEVNGLKALSPGHFGKPSEDCRCRCTVLIKPRWDVDSRFTKRDNETKELLEFKNIKNYEEFKKKYWATADNSIKSTMPLKKAVASIDKSGESDIIKTNENFEIHPDKINKFLLKPGSKHSKEFFDVGYSENDYSRLFDDIAAEFNKSDILDIKKNPDGTENFSTFMELGVENKKRFRIVCRKDTPESKPRLITGHRED